MYNKVSHPMSLCFNVRRYLINYLHASHWHMEVHDNCKMKIPERKYQRKLFPTLSPTDRSIVSCSISAVRKMERVHGLKRVVCSILTRKPAVVVGVTVVSIKLCGDWGSVTNQQEDEAHSFHFSTWERFAHCHLQKVNIALTTFLNYVLKKRHFSQN